MRKKKKKIPTWSELRERAAKQVSLGESLERLEERYGPAAAQAAYNGLFWQVIREEYVTVPYSRNVEGGLRWVPRDEHDEIDGG